MPFLEAREHAEHARQQAERIAEIRGRYREHRPIFMEDAEWLLEQLAARQQAHRQLPRHYGESEHANMSEPRVIFDYLGIHHDMSIEESMQLRAAIAGTLYALKVKCPGCRCFLLPGEPCGCCADVALAAGGVQRE